ncbi:hypothetical protein GM418_01435 [Maribellus comscasis]|uniref:Uncharacterized protein n=1 Tax=Maribellus comscasis TaxID=2681766 RepID=A0A6I6JQS8_9BACT|nr:hypothetical protein [Maribellus comscasis]QGY42363.1 hypothetical protein GM418_01435 [Maribellus comscasis]
MHENVFLYTLPQWFIFSSVLVMVYGWVEKKKPFRIIGLVILIALAFFSLYAIVKGYFDSHNFLTPDEVINEELNGELVEEIPFEGIILPAYWSFVISGITAIPALYFEIKCKRQSRLFIVLAVVISLFGFFVIVDALKYI